MNRTFKEKAVLKAATFSKKHKPLKPFVFLGLGLLVGAYNVFLYFKNNSKRYITMGLFVMFFIMSSSFATPEQSADKETYLADSESVVTDEGETVVAVAETEEFTDDLSMISNVSDEDIVSTDVLSESLENDLKNTDNVDKFTVNDLLKKKQENETVVEDTESSFDKNAWNLILVNKTHPVPDGYVVPLTTIKGNMQCDERVLDILVSMLNAAEEDGVNLMVVSPYRDYQLQKVLFERKINTYMDLGLSYLEAYKIASRKVIVPGASEHQLGIAFDIVTGSHTTLDYEFGDTEAGKWLKEHGSEYGFILRYPRGKNYITGIEYEPWHYRYVGVEAATYIMENDLTLEEFIESLD